MCVRIIADLDDIRDRSDASAAANKISLLDALHLVAMSWKRVSEKTIENCFRKGEFSKTNFETPASEESDLTSEIFDQAPDGMPKEEFENSLGIDNNAEVVATMTLSEICQAVADDKSKLAEESESNYTSKEEEILEAPPTNARCEMVYEFFVVVCNIEQQISKGIMSMSNSFRNY
jgi:hypothetical protein